MRRERQFGAERMQFLEIKAQHAAALHAQRAAHDVRRHERVAIAIAADPTSFLRLAQVPFCATMADGAELNLLRVEVDDVTDVGSVMPHLGGATFRYDPLPAALVVRRRRLRFVYGDGTATRGLSFAQVRALMPA